jgi:4-hydroxy-tetrahydrodipicolinate synthase
MRMHIKGLYTALITPFLPDGSLDKEGLEELIHFQIEGGVDGLVLLGTTGEAPTLEEHERIQIMETGVRLAKGKVKLCFGVGSYSTKTTIQNAKLAKKIGADSLLIVTPYYNRPPQEGIFRHFEAVCNEVDLPICVYNIASRTGQNIEPATLARIAELPNICSVKESSGNLLQMSDIIQRICLNKPDFSIVSGDDSFTLPLMAIGGHGLISVIGNLTPSHMKQLIEAAKDDIQKAQKINHQLKPLISASTLDTNPIAIKRMCALSNLPAGLCRLPLSPLSSENEQKMKKILSDCQYIIEEELAYAKK